MRFDAEKWSDVHCSRDTRSIVLKRTCTTKKSNRELQFTHRLTRHLVVFFQRFKRRANTVSLFSLLRGVTRRRCAFEPCLCDRSASPPSSSPCLRRRFAVTPERPCPTWYGNPRRPDKVLQLSTIRYCSYYYYCETARPRVMRFFSRLNASRRHLDG